MPKTTDASDFWEQSDYATKEYVEAPLTDIELARVEKALGYKLPAVYAALCREQNGGIPTRTNDRTQERTSWAEIRGQHRGHSYLLGRPRPDRLIAMLHARPHGHEHREIQTGASGKERPRSVPG